MYQFWSESTNLIPTERNPACILKSQKCRTAEIPVAWHCNTHIKNYSHGWSHDKGRNLSNSISVNWDYLAWIHMNKMHGFQDYNVRLCKWVTTTVYTVRSCQCLFCHSTCLSVSLLGLSPPDKHDTREITEHGQSNQSLYLHLTNIPLAADVSHCQALSLKGSQQMQ